MWNRPNCERRVPLPGKNNNDVRTPKENQAIHSAKSDEQLHETLSLTVWAERRQPQQEIVTQTEQVLHQMNGSGVGEDTDTQTLLQPPQRVDTDQWQQQQSRQLWDWTQCENQTWKPFWPWWRRRSAYLLCSSLVRPSMCPIFSSARRGTTGPEIWSSGGRQEEEYSSSRIQHRNAKTTWKTGQKNSPDWQIIV